MYKMRPDLYKDLESGMLVLMLIENALNLGKWKGVFQVYLGYSWYLVTILFP